MNRHPGPLAEEHRPPEVSVVIPVRNGASTIGDQLAALADQDFDGRYEVVVADNGSIDATTDVVSGLSDVMPALKLVDASSRKGPNYARNIGAYVASGQLLLFCDCDDVVSSTWISAMVEALRTADAVGGRVLRFGSGASRHSPSPYDPVEPDSTFLPSPIGANCGVHRRIWVELGGFDESYRGRSGDEVEFFWRLQLAGYSLTSAPNAIVNYRVRSARWFLKSFRIGREHVKLHRDFRAYGHPGSSVSALRAWGWIIVSAPGAAISSTKRKVWLRVFARRLGHIMGVIRYGHPAFLLSGGRIRVRSGIG